MLSVDKRIFNYFHRYAVALFEKKPYIWRAFLS